MNIVVPTELLALFGDYSWLLIIVGGCLVGFLVGLTGVGAGALTTPMLITGFGVAPVVAVGTDLVFAAVTKASGGVRHHRMGNVNWPIFAYLVLGSTASALVTIAGLMWLEPDMEALAKVIRGGLSVALVVSAVAIPLIPILMRRQVHTPDSSVEPKRIATVVFGLLLGALVVITSVGAGAIGVAVLSALYPRLTARRIVGTDVVHAVPLTAISGVGHMWLGHVDLALLGLLVVGSVPGILLGARLVGTIPDWLLRVVLSIVLLYAAYLLTAHPE